MVTESLPRAVTNASSSPRLKLLSSEGCTSIRQRNVTTSKRLLTSHTCCEAAPSGTHAYFTPPSLLLWLAVWRSRSALLLTAH